MKKNKKILFNLLSIDNKKTSSVVFFIHFIKFYFYFFREGLEAKDFKGD